MDYPFISLGPAIQAIALGLLFAMLLVGIGAAIFLAALPGRIAAAKQHPQAPAVNICGWLGLPTGILWAAALIWAYWRHSGVTSQELDSQLSKLELAVSQLEGQRKLGS